MSYNEAKEVTITVGWTQLTCQAAHCIHNTIRTTHKPNCDVGYNEMDDHGICIHFEQAGHGEGEKGEDACYICKQVGNHESWCSRGKPSPAPTREEWEKWAEDMAYRLGTSAEHRTHIIMTLLEMPIVPKE